MSNDAAIDSDDLGPPPKRRVAMPLLLFLATCLSTFWVGAVDWKPVGHFEALHSGFSSFVSNWRQGHPVAALDEAMAVAKMNWSQGLLYMGLVLGVLLTHEMGHFLMTLRHRIPASLPYFIPLPAVPFGTLGAVIGMDGGRANRRELFDMGVAGPMAGLIVAIPITVLGILQLPAQPLPGESLCFHNPAAFKWLIALLRPEYPTPGVLYLNQFNAFLMAGWMGMLVTGLNMLPISQLDGGHVAYSLFGREGAHVLARGLLVMSILFIVGTERYAWIVMLVLVILMGTDHPPTADDECDIGRFRKLIGWIALLTPIFCFPPMGITPIGR
jgi:Zn-dependent protease